MGVIYEAGHSARDLVIPGGVYNRIFFKSGANAVGLAAVSKEKNDKPDAD